MYRLLSLSPESTLTFLQKTVDTDCVIHLIIIDNERYFVVDELSQKLKISTETLDHLCKIKSFPVYFVTNIQDHNGTTLINFLINHKIIKPLIQNQSQSLISLQLFKYTKQTFEEFFSELRLLRPRSSNRSTLKSTTTTQIVAWEEAFDQTPFLLPDQIFIEYKTLVKIIKRTCSHVLQNITFKSTLLKMVTNTKSKNHKILHLLSVLSYFYLHHLVDLCATLSSEYFLPNICSYVNDHLFPGHKVLVIVSKEHGHLISPLTKLELPIEIISKRYEIPKSIQCFIGLNDQITEAPSYLYKLENFHHSYFENKKTMQIVNVFE